MAGAFYDRVKESSTSTGTGNFTLDGAVAGYVTFNSAFSTTVQFYYCIEAVDADGIATDDWEVGIGHLSNSTTLVRDYVLYSSNSNAAVNFGAGDTYVFNPFPATQALGCVSLFSLTYGMP